MNKSPRRLLRAAALILALGALASVPAHAQEPPLCSEACSASPYPFCSTQCVPYSGAASVSCGDVVWPCLPDLCQRGHFVDSGAAPRLVGQRTKVVRRRVGGIFRNVNVVVNLWAAAQFYVHDPQEGNCTEPDNCDRLYETDGCVGGLSTGNWGSMTCHPPTGFDQSLCTIQF